jgi:hypothetical protein
MKSPSVEVDPTIGSISKSRKIERLLYQGEEIQITKRRHVIARLVPEIE